MRKTLLSLALPALLAACGYVDRYEAGVYDFEPVYCYRTIGAVRCFKTPDHRDERRLVNYYGPHPSRYERPAPAARPAFKAPPPVAFYVRDPEPVPEPVRPRRRPAARRGRRGGGHQARRADRDLLRSAARRGRCLRGAGAPRRRR